MEHTIDTAEKTIGRTASRAATILMGKHKPGFKRNAITGEKVHIVNASKAKIGVKKMETVFHETYSGYPGGIKRRSAGALAGKKGYGELFRLAVYGMLPANKLRPKIMKNLKVSE